MKAPRTKSQYRSQQGSSEKWKKVVVVVREPLHVEAFVTESGLLGFFATLGEQWPRTIIFQRILTRPDTHLFFAQLASVLGYEVEKSRRVRMPNAWILPRPQRLSKRDRKRLDKLGALHLRVRFRYTANAMARISVPVPQRTLLRLCRAIAEDLDWELTEGRRTDASR